MEIHDVVIIPAEVGNGDNSSRRKEVLIARLGPGWLTNQGTVIPYSQVSQLIPAGRDAMPTLSVAAKHLLAIEDAK